MHALQSFPHQESAFKPNNQIDVDAGSVPQVYPLDLSYQLLASARESSDAQSWYIKHRGTSWWFSVKTLHSEFVNLGSISHQEIPDPTCQLKIPHAATKTPQSNK